MQNSAPRRLDVTRPIIPGSGINSQCEKHLRRVPMARADYHLLLTYRAQHPRKIVDQQRFIYWFILVEAAARDEFSRARMEDILFEAYDANMIVSEADQHFFSTHTEPAEFDDEDLPLERPVLRRSL